MNLSWIAEFWAAYFPPWAVALLGLASAVLFALIVHALAYRVARRLLRRHQQGTTAAFLRRIRWPTRLILVAFALTAILPALPISIEATLLLQRLSSLALIAMTGWMAVSLVNLGGDIVSLRYNIAIADNIAARRVQTQLRILLRTTNLALMVITASIMLMTIPGVREFGVSLFASAGVAGLAIGLAARPLLANLIAGLQIALAQPIRLNDVVIVEGEWGRIEEITSTFVVVKIWDERRLVVPLSQFIEKPFQNWTRSSDQLIGTVFWYLDYGAPIDAMRKKLDEIVKASPLWDKRVAGIQVTGADRQTVEIRALVSARDSSAAWDLRCLVREQMIDFLKESYPESLPRARTVLERPLTGEIALKPNGQAPFGTTEAGAEAARSAGSAAKTGPA
ncbi:MAG: mechanosensitive ion channel [Rhodospirillaceae bacterium]|nr:mechanosensitive ion channel [Rhodospirillaceae bacterium]